MKKFIVWLFIKTIAPEIKVVFVNDGSSFEYETNTIYLDLDENCDSFMRHLNKAHLLQYYQDNAMFNMNLGLHDINKIIWQVLHEIGHYYTLDFIEENDDETFERAVCSLIDKDTAESNEKIQDIYFNLEKEWQATEWAIRYVDRHFTKCKFFNKFLKNS